uniref:Integrase catalytic domain-containing protein n=1 Tax=Tanacetum cinerariifolium TaxID=118510 RepID=A0A699HQR3_TANCI|nr:hypothetical protein [Tanacetum cinerariifolium]
MGLREIDCEFIFIVGLARFIAHANIYHLSTMATSLTDINLDIIQTHILPCLDGLSITNTSSVSSELQSLCSDNDLWSPISKSTWPSIIDPRVDNIISTFPGGHRSFYKHSFGALFTERSKHKKTLRKPLKAKFKTLSMKDTEIIDDFAMKVNNIVSNIRALREKVEEAYVVKKLLRAVLSKFLQIDSTIKQFADLDNMIVEEVIGWLKAHEERVHGKSKIGEGKLLLTHQEWLERSKKKGDEEQRTSQRNTRSSASIIKVEEEAGEESPRKEKNQEANLTQKDDEPALLLAVKHKVNEDVFLNKKHLTPKLRNLNEESNTSKKFRVLVENKTGVKVKTLQTDRRGEFNSKAFTEYCDNTGLKHHFTAPYSPQQNGVMERRNQWIIEMARSIMKSMEVPDTLWAEVVRQAVYIQNRVPTKTLGDTTPYESWSGKKPNLEHLRVFGSKAYRLLDPVSGRIRVSKDVRFEEGKQWLWGEATKFKENPKSTFTIEGYNQEDTNLEDENDLTGRKPIGLKWVYKLKRDPSGNILKHKERLVAKGYVQKLRVGFDEVFAPVARIDTIQILLALASLHGWKVHHLDVKSVFLNGRLEEEVYVTQPEGFVKANHPEKVYKQSKALYGLRQAPRAWNSRLDKCLKRLNFTRCGLEYVVYTRKQHGNILIVVVYVDDLIVTRNCDGIEVTQHEDAITLKKSAYARKGEGGVSFNPTLFHSIIRGLRYLTHIRPDIAYAIEIVSRFMEKPTVNHMQAVKRILWYIKGIVNYGLVYTKYHKGDVIIGYSDSNHARDVEDRWSTGGMVFYLKENLVTWARKSNNEITRKKAGLCVLYIDNKSAIELIKNLVFHGRSKHIDLRYHFIRECVERGDVVIKHVCSKEQRADILMKPLPRIQFIEMRKMMGVKSIIDSELRGKLIDGHVDFEIGDHKSSSEQRDCSSDVTAEVLVSDGPSRRGRINLRRTSVTGFPAQSISSSNTIALDSPNLLVLNTETSQSKQHGIMRRT